MSLNNVCIMGRLTSDPELRRTNSGVAVTTFVLAVDRDFKAQNGERETDFFTVTAWRNTAEFAAKFFAKGRAAVVSGRLQTEEWMDKDGGKRKGVKIVAENIYFGDNKHSGEIADPSAGQFAEVDEDDGSLPF